MLRGVWATGIKIAPDTAKYCVHSEGVIEAFATSLSATGNAPTPSTINVRTHIREGVLNEQG